MTAAAEIWMSGFEPESLSDWALCHWATFILCELLCGWDICGLFIALFIVYVFVRDLMIHFIDGLWVLDDWCLCCGGLWWLISSLIQWDWLRLWRTDGRLASSKYLRVFFNSSELHGTLTKPNTVRHASMHINQTNTLWIQSQGPRNGIYRIFIGMIWLWIIKYGGSRIDIINMIGSIEWMLSKWKERRRRLTNRKEMKRERR